MSQNDDDPEINILGFELDKNQFVGLGMTAAAAAMAWNHKRGKVAQQSNPKEGDFHVGWKISQQGNQYPYGSDLAFRAYEDGALRGYGQALISYQWACLLKGLGPNSYQLAVDLFQETFIKCSNPPSNLQKDYLNQYMTFRPLALSNHGLALISCGKLPAEAFAYFEQAKTGESKIFSTVLALQLGDNEKAASLFKTLASYEKDALAVSLTEDIGKCEQNAWTVNWLKDCQRILPGDLTVQLECVLPMPAASLAEGPGKLDASSRLSNLQKLLSDGLITQTEFDQKRSQILEDL